MTIKDIYYILKPVIPRRIQILLRQRHVLKQQKSASLSWPIDKEANIVPHSWRGWPENKQFALVLQHDVDTQKGLDKTLCLANLEEKLGFRSSFNFVPRRYDISRSLRDTLTEKGFEIGVHGLFHDGRLFSSRTIFSERAVEINNILKDWNVTCFTSPSMHHKLEWMHELDISHGTSTFDTDPFEPQPDGVKTIFPFWVNGNSLNKGYIELPYTLPQDFTLFILMKKKNINIWKEKLDWIAQNGGMALLNSHPDYMNFDVSNKSIEEYPSQYYEEFLCYIRETYEGKFWHALPRDIAGYCKNNLETIKHFTPCS